MTFVNITPEMRARILERIRQVRADALREFVVAGIFTEEQAQAEAERLPDLVLPKPLGEKLQ